MSHITITIPVFNRADLVARTIESALHQSFIDFDLLVVDDASTDDTVFVVQKYCQLDPRVKLEVNPKNLGLTRNWNRCLELAQGPLVQVLLSDDLIDPDYLTIVSEVFEKYPMVGLVASSCRYIDAQDQIISPGVTISDRLYAAGDEAVAALILEGYPHVSSVVFKRECYEGLGKYDERIWHGPDMEFDARITSKYGYYRFGTPHTSFRRHGSNMGSLEYLRHDFLDVDFLKRRKTLEYLSSEGRRQLGIVDLDEFLTKTEAQVALTGAISSITYNRPALSRFYLRQAFHYDKRVWRKMLFWKGIVLNIWPTLGCALLQRRFGVKQSDRFAISAVEKSLHDLQRT